MKKTYFITAILNHNNKTVTVWVKANSILDALNKSFNVIETEYKIESTYDITGIWMGDNNR